MKKLLKSVSMVIIAIVYISMSTIATSAEELQNYQETDAVVIDEQNNFLTNSEDIESIEESPIYFINNRLTRQNVGRMVYKNVTIVKSNGVGIFARSIYYSKKEAGFTTPFEGTLYLQNYWSQNNGSYTVYFAKYTGSVGAYLG